jgi:hypothetical protein
MEIEIDIDDGILAGAKAAAERNTTLDALVNEALLFVLSGRKPRALWNEGKG